MGARDSISVLGTACDILGMVATATGQQEEAGAPQNRCGGKQKPGRVVQGGSG